jgi:hypothetical protein
MNYFEHENGGAEHRRRWPDPPDFAARALRGRRLWS